MVKLTKLLFFMFIFVFVARQSHALDMRSNWRNWIFIIGHGGYNINALYWQITQIIDIGKVPLPDNEDGVPEDEKFCGHICQTNSMQIREHSKHVKNLNGLASVISVSAFLFNAVTFLKLIQNQEANYLLFQNIAKGLSVTNSFFNWASMASLIELELHYRTNEIPRPIQV